METENPEVSILRPGNSGGGQALTKVGFGTVETVNQRESQGTALAERARAEVQSRYIMADRRPRNIEQVRVRLLEHCRRPKFAARAEYAKPVGGQKVRGPSIRFVETALQEFGNVLPASQITYDDDFRRIVQVSVTDLERNITYYDDATAEKFVERRNPKDGDEILGSRQNSYGTTTYKVRATEDDFANKMASAVSKKTRNLGLRILPADIVEEAMEVCRETVATKDAQDPSAARRQIADAFAAIRVMPLDLDAYLGHPFDQASPAELGELRAAYSAVRDGEAKWVDLVDAQRIARGEIEPEDASKTAKVAGDKLKAKIEEVKKTQAAKAAEEAKKKAAEDARKSGDGKPGEMTDAEKREIEAAERKAGGK